MATVAEKWISSDLEGSRVLLRMRDGDVEGVVVGVCEKTARLSLRDVLDVETQEKMAGQLHCHAKDITSCVILGNSARKRYILTQEQEGPRLLRVRPVPGHLEKLNATVNSCEFICHRMEGDTSEVIKKGSIKLMGYPEEVPKLKLPIATEFEVVDEVDNLNEAIAAIKEERSISVGYEGTKVGRHGLLSVLVVATSSKVYIFDVLAFKMELFSNGLKEILESKDIEKVIHGCRYLSDCLYHQYEVMLDNVFDTMVADIILEHNTLVDTGRYKFPSLVRGTQKCIKSFLKFGYVQLKYTRSRLGTQEEEVCTWQQRPLSLRQIDALAKDVVFLRELAQACLEQMLKKFHSGVNFFLTFDRDCTDEELSYLPAAHVLPMGFADAVKSDTFCSKQQWREYTGRDRNREDSHHGGRENNRTYEHNYARHGPSWMSGDRMQFREPGDASYTRGHVWRQDEFSGEQNFEDKSLFHIGMAQRAKGNPAPGDTAELANPAQHVWRRNQFSGEQNCEDKSLFDIGMAQRAKGNPAPGDRAASVHTGSESRGKSSLNNEESKKLSESPVNIHKHASACEPQAQHCTPVEAAEGKRVQDIVDVRYALSQRPLSSGIPEGNAAAFGQGHDTFEATADIEREVPRCKSAWADRRVDSTAERSFPPAELTVQNCRS